jgi:hypothetical protein
MSISLFQAGDAVFYNGPRFKQELVAKDGKPFKGWIHATVKNQPGAYVVWFPETKESDSFIMSEANLTKARPPRIDKMDDGVVIEHMPYRRRKSEDD